MSRYDLTSLRDLRAQTIKIGVITPSTSGYEVNVPLFRQIIQSDINEYVHKLPSYRFYPSLEFQFIVENAERSDDIHLQKVQNFHENGVDLIIGGGWSSQSEVSLPYVNDNNMLLFSHSSTSSSLSIEHDNLFRMCLDNMHQARAMVEMLVSKEIRAVIFIHIANTYGNDLYNCFTMAFQRRGGIVYASHSYPPEQQDFTNLMSSAETDAMNAVGEYGAENVGVVLIGYDQNYLIVDIAAGYPTLYSLLWFSTEAAGCSENMLEPPARAEAACHLKIYSTYFKPTYSSKFRKMGRRFYEVTNHRFDYYAACKIDIAWVIAMAVIDIACSVELPKTKVRTRVLAQDVMKVIPDIASRYFGYSGWCLLNEAGDRANGNYDIWGYGYDDMTGDPTIKLYGEYNSDLRQITWFQI